jgi:hypothetical protein
MTKARNANSLGVGLEKTVEAMPRRAMIKARNAANSLGVRLERRVVAMPQSPVVLVERTVEERETDKLMNCENIYSPADSKCLPNYCDRAVN